MSPSIPKPVRLDAFLDKLVGTGLFDLGPLGAAQVMLLQWMVLDRQPTQALLAAAYERGVGIVLMAGAAGIDLLIPILLPDGTFSAIVIQVKNRLYVSPSKRGTDVAGMAPSRAFCSSKFVSDLKDLKPATVPGIWLNVYSDSEVTARTERVGDPDLPHVVAVHGVASLGIFHDKRRMGLYESLVRLRDMSRDPLDSFQLSAALKETCRR